MPAAATGGARPALRVFVPFNPAETRLSAGTRTYRPSGPSRAGSPGSRSGPELSRQRVCTAPPGAARRCTPSAFRKLQRGLRVTPGRAEPGQAEPGRAYLKLERHRGARTGSHGYSPGALRFDSQGAGLPPAAVLQLRIGPHRHVTSCSGGSAAHWSVESLWRS